MKIFRWLIIAVVVVLVIVAAGVAYLSTTFDPNDHRERIVQVVKERTGRSLHIDAPMSLSFFPWFGIQLAKVSLDNPPEFDDQTFFTAEQLGVRLEVAALLNGQLIVDELKLGGVKVNFHRRADGSDNWSDILSATEEKTDEKTADSGAKDLAQQWIKGYAIRGVSLTDGRLSWRDETAGDHFVFNEVGLKTGTITPGKAVPLEGSVQFSDQVAKNAVGLLFAGSLGLSEDLQKVTIPDLSLKTDLSKAGLPSAASEYQLDSAVTFDRAAGSLTLDSIILSGPGGLSVTGDLSAATGEVLAYEGKFKVAPFSLKTVLDTVVDSPIKTSDPNALQSLSASFDLKGSAKELLVKPLSLRLDDTSINGQLKANLGESTAISFSLAADAINLDRYMAPSTESTNSSSTGGGAAKGDEGGLGAIAYVNSRGSLSLGTLKVSGLTMKDTRVEVRTGGGKLSLDPMKAKLYGGQYNGHLRATAKGKTVSWNAREQINGIEIGNLLSDLTGKEERLQGKGSLNAELSGVGLSENAIRRTAKGQVKFDFRDGSLKGINLAQVFREVKAKLKGGSAPKKEPQKTDFSRLQGSLQVADGVARNSDLIMKSPFIRVEGKGSALLVEETLDYKMLAKIVGSTKGQGGAELQDLEGVPLAVKVSGTFTDPKFRPDIEAMIRAAASKRLEKEKAKLEKKAQEKIDEETQKLQEKVEDKLKDALKGLF